MLEVNNLSYSLEHKQVLHNINLEVKARQITTILGANGSGKSTLLRAMSGLLEPDSGEIKFEGKKIMSPSQKLIPGHPGIALVRQDNRLFPLHTVRQNLRHVLQAYNDQYREEKTEELSSLLGLNANLDRPLKHLSGGEQQRVSIAAALASEPKLLLMDEPFSQTDMYLKQQLKQHLIKIVEKLGIGLLFVTHDSIDALALADEIMILDNGKIVEKGNSRDVYYHPKQRATAILTGYCNWLPKELFKKVLNLQSINDLYLLRPDHIKVFAKPEESALKATVTKIEFCGFYQCIYLQLTQYKLSLMTTQIPSLSTPKPGQEVWVSF